MQTTTLDPVTPLPGVIISLPLTPVPRVVNVPEVPAIYGTPVSVEGICYRCPGKATTECDRCGKPLCTQCYTTDIGPCQIERRLCTPCITIRDSEREERAREYREGVAWMHGRYPHPYLPRLEG